MYAAAIAVVMIACGCFSPGKKDVHDPDPSLKLPAVKTAVEKKDYSVLKQLVKDLESDDPAVRFMAIEGLKKLAGQDFGYQYFADEEKRALPVERWNAWYQGWEAARKEMGKN
jgi:hypothetical protein